MKGYRIKVIKSNLNTYWYAKHIGEEFWAVLAENIDSSQDYKVILEGITPLSGFGTKWINFDDCEIIKESEIQIESHVVVNVVEI